MVLVEFLGPIDRDNLELDIDNLGQLKVILSQEAKMQEWLQMCAVAVNDTIVSSLDLSLKDGDRVSLLPPVCGG